MVVYFKLSRAISKGLVGSEGRVGGGGGCGINVKEERVCLCIFFCLWFFLSVYFGYLGNYYIVRIFLIGYELRFNVGGVLIRRYNRLFEFGFLG